MWVQGSGLTLHVVCTMLYTWTHFSGFTMASSKSQQQAYAAIMKGITEVNFEGPPVPGVFILSGDHAFPLLTNRKGKVQAAASLYGAGRLVALCHEAYLTTLPELVENALNWLRGDSDNMTVGVHKRVRKVAANPFKANFLIKVMPKFSSDQGIRVFVADDFSVEGNDKEMIEFLKAGGGVLIAGQAWHWSYQHPNDNIFLDYWGNKLSAVAGVYFLGKYGEAGRFSVAPQIPPLTTAIIDSFTKDREALLDSVSDLSFPESSLGSEILVHGRLSFPIAWNNDGKVFAAGGYYGKGRVIAVSHKNFLEANERFWQNALRWLDRGRQGVVGVDPYHTITVLQKSGLNVEQTKFKAGLSVYVCTTWRDTYIREMQEFVSEGGGLVLAGHAWTFIQHSDLNYLTECPGNKILNPMGLTQLSTTLSMGVFPVPNSNTTLENHHFRHIFNLFLDFMSGNKTLTPEEEKKMNIKSKHVLAFFQTYQHQNYFYQQALSKLVEFLKKEGIPQVSASSPAKSLKEKLILNLLAPVYKASPDSDEFMRSVQRNPPDLPTVQDQRISFSADTGDRVEWISTGLYLAPGMKTNMTFPTEMINKGWKVQISCQSDKLDPQEDLARASVVYERFPIVSGSMEVHNFWGGLIYLIAPAHTKLTDAEVTVQRAVLAPYYKSGVTALSDWPQIRSAPSPWAELEFENIILTVPSDAVRNLDRPDEVGALWDRIMRAVADLAAIPPKFRRKERIICDVQISAGSMHSGYPIMGHIRKAAVITSLAEIQRIGLWGPIHTLGCNQRRWQWDFRPHTGESTCNLWSVFVSETVLGFTVDMSQAHELTREFRNGEIEEFVRGGRNLDDWRKWKALETYLQLKEKFGWEPFKKVFALYRAMDDSTIPRDNPGKMNLYAVTFSQVVMTNLSDFFKSWSWPINADTERKLSSLPPWTDHPMAKYNN